MTKYNSLGTDTKLLVSSDANFVLNRFPCYTLGANNMIIEKNDNPSVPSLKEIVAMETIQLIEQQKRLSVRVLAEKFEKGLATVAKLSNEVQIFQYNISNLILNIYIILIYHYTLTLRISK